MSSVPSGLATSPAEAPSRPGFSLRGLASLFILSGFAALIYPGGVLDQQDKEKLSPETRVTKEPPPSFLPVASDDNGSAPGTIRLFQSLRDAGVSAEIHVYASGGHGFGMRKSDQACASWPQRCEEWMRGRGFLKK